MQINALRLLPEADRERLKALERRLVTVFAEAVHALNPPAFAGRPLPKPVTMSLFGMLSWFYMWFREDGGMSRAQYAELAARMFVGCARPRLRLAGMTPPVASRGMDTKPDPFEEALSALIRRLHGRGRLRVWSLAVTLFGDAFAPRGGRAPLAALQAVTGRLGVEPGALRTAMSRLAAEGWVERERVGRNSFFRLAQGGRHAFDLATRRIYAAGPPDWDGRWTVAIAAPGGSAEAGAELEGAGFIRLGGGVFLRPHMAGAAPAQSAFAGMLVVHGSSAEHPETLRDLWPSAETARAYRELMAAWRTIAGTLRQGKAPAPLDAIAARTLLIHDWRRIVLRDPGLPLELLPADWPGEEARALVRSLYRGLSGPSEAWLDGAGLPPHADRAAFANRFGGTAAPGT